MSLFDPPERGFVEVFSQLINCNPFLPEWVELERKALGTEFQEAPRTYSWRSHWSPMHIHPNVAALGERVTRLGQQAQQRLLEGRKATAQELDSYRDLAFYHLYRHCANELDRVILASRKKETPPATAGIWDQFQSAFDLFFVQTGVALPPERRPDHVFAWFFQLRRAFYHIYANIVGISEPAARLRGAVWQSIFTHDMRRWSRALYDRMGDFPTLITGPSGTGKELVARAVALSRYIPFDPKKKSFKPNFAGSFHPLNLSALAATLIESELFGHKQGSFTGATADRVGWLEECEEHYGKHGTVFLDEVGELDAGIQVKLLRVLQTRCFQRLGESQDREFHGKIIAATNRDLAAEMRAGRFREDFYYRLCADRITTPSLQEQLHDAPEDLHNLLLFIARREITDEEAESLATEVEGWIKRSLPGNYPWPGNFRELEQCVRNVMIRQTYQPAHLDRPRDDSDPATGAGDRDQRGTIDRPGAGAAHFYPGLLPDRQLSTGGKTSGLQLADVTGQDRSRVLAGVIVPPGKEVAEMLPRMMTRPGSFQILVEFQSCPFCLSFVFSGEPPNAKPQNTPKIAPIVAPSQGAV